MNFSETLKNWHEILTALLLQMQNTPKTGNERTMKNIQFFKIRVIKYKTTIQLPNQFSRLGRKHFIIKWLETETTLLTGLKNTSSNISAGKLPTPYKQVHRTGLKFMNKQTYSCYQSGHTAQKLFALWPLSPGIVTSLTQQWISLLCFACFGACKNSNYSI